MYRELVLEAAEKVFAEEGYEKAKVQQIAAEAGIAPATFYQVFPGKWDVYRAVHELRGRQLMEAAISRLDLARPTLEVMLAGMEAYVRFHFEHPTYLRMHLREGNAWAVAPDLRSEEQHAMWQVGVAMTVTLFRRGIEEGLFAEDDTEVMARTMIAMHQVRLAAWIERGMPADTEALLLAMRQQFIRTFCRAEHVEEQIRSHALRAGAAAQLEDVSQR
jgi:AcrR family transcriptional regulator